MPRRQALNSFACDLRAGARPLSAVGDVAKGNDKPHAAPGGGSCKRETRLRHSRTQLGRADIARLMAASSELEDSRDGASSLRSGRRGRGARGPPAL